MSDKQGKGKGEGAVEKNTSRPNEQSGSGSGSGGQRSSHKATDAVQKGREQTRSDIGKTLGK